jgi:hypothetical protein
MEKLPVDVQALVQKAYPRILELCCLEERLVS